MALTETKDDILNILYQSDDRLTSRAFIRQIKAKFSISGAEAKKIVQKLVNEQELSYHYLYGSTYIEKNFLRPVHITKNFILKPPGHKAEPKQSRIEIMIETGISFGSGHHPTTQLCLTALDFCFFEHPGSNLQKNLPGADIGTGSGVLAMAMCLSGLISCNAYEIDPVSINEAKKNIALNGLGKRIKVIKDPIEENKNAFSIISANLRFPTLLALGDLIYASLTQNGIAVISGVRQWEKDQFIRIYSKKGFKLFWQKDDKKWSAFVLEKK